MAHDDDLLHDTSDDADDQVSDDTSDDSSEEEKSVENPIEVLEKESEDNDEFSEPEGLEQDPGFVDEANWQAGEVERGAERGYNDDDEDVESLGMHIDNGSRGSSVDEDADSIDEDEM